MLRDEKQGDKHLSLSTHMGRTHMHNAPLQQQVMNSMKLDLGTKGAPVRLRVTKRRDECAFTVISPGQPWPWSKSWFSQLPQVLFVVLGLCSKRSLVRLDRINWVILIKPYMGRSNCWLQWSEMENDEPILFWMHLFQFYKCLFKQDFF